MISGVGITAYSKKCVELPTADVLIIERATEPMTTDVTPLFFNTNVQ